MKSARAIVEKMPAMLGVVFSQAVAPAVDLQTWLRRGPSVLPGARRLVLAVTE